MRIAKRITRPENRHQHGRDQILPDCTGILRQTLSKLFAFWRRSGRAFTWRFVLIPLPFSAMLGANYHQGRWALVILASWIIHACLPRSWRLPKRSLGEVLPGIDAAELRRRLQIVNAPENSKAG